ncbi:hypothetical protein FRC12_008459 [Ceratobasidium sp. 428]|nr:hypothetical protein FRC12_008459 [Ceratobasidium sp. 428]
MSLVILFHLLNSVLCPYPNCDRSFSAHQFLDLSIHIVTHLEIKDENCRFQGCSATFGNPSARNRHEREVHESRFEFACDQCNDMFKRCSQLMIHKRLVHMPDKARKMPRQTGRKQVEHEVIMTPLLGQNVASTITTSNSLVVAPSNSAPQVGNPSISNLLSCFNSQPNIHERRPFDANPGSMGLLSREKSEDSKLDLDMVADSFSHLGVRDLKNITQPSVFDQYPLEALSQLSAFAVAQPASHLDHATQGKQYHQVSHRLLYTPYPRPPIRCEYASKLC